MSFYNDEKIKMEKYKTAYHNSGKIAETATINYKDLAIKKKLNDQNAMNQAIEKSKIDCKNRLITMAKDCNTYYASVKNVDKLRKELNKKQDNLLLLYQNLEWDDKNLYYNVMEIIRKYQKKVLDYTGQQLNDVEIIQKSIDIDKDIRGLVAKLRRYDSPEEEIIYEHYPSDIDFDKCQDSKDYKVYDAIVKEMKSHVDNIFNEYDEKLEEKKNKMRELVYKFFDKNKTTNEDEKKMEYDFYTFCPIAGCPNNNKPIKWQHYNCGGYTKINDEGYIRCPKCNVKGKVVDWKFSCENHDFEEPNVQKLISILSVMQQILDIDNDDFIIDLSSIVKDQYKEKKKKREEEEKNDLIDKINEDNKKSEITIKLNEDDNKEKTDIQLISNDNKDDKNDLIDNNIPSNENKDNLESNTEIQNEENKSELKIEDKNIVENATSSELKFENKYDFLNLGTSLNTPNLLNQEENIKKENKNEEKPKEESIYDKYPFLNKPELSDYTKAYLSSYSSGTRPELSDYTKAYLSTLTTNTTNTSSTNRPELSNLTKEYLSLYTTKVGESDEKKKIKF